MTMILETSYQALVGLVLNKIRQERRMTLADVSKHVGVSSSVWSRIEKGESGLSLEQFFVASSVLGLQPGIVLDIADKAVRKMNQTKECVVIRRRADVSETVNWGIADVPVSLKGSVVLPQLLGASIIAQVKDALAKVGT
jgi:transcriptional regulator with XRE-family HTH domain